MFCLLASPLLLFPVFGLSHVSCPGGASATNRVGELGCQCQRLSLNISRSFLYNVGRPGTGEEGPQGGQVTLWRAELVSRTRYGMGFGTRDGKEAQERQAPDLWWVNFGKTKRRWTGHVLREDRTGQNNRDMMGQDRTGQGLGLGQAKDWT